MINEIRQKKTKTKNENNLNNNCDEKADENEFDKKIRLVIMSKKKKRLS